MCLTLQNTAQQADGDRKRESKRKTKKLVNSDINHRIRFYCLNVKAEPELYENNNKNIFCGVLVFFSVILPLML